MLFGLGSARKVRGWPGARQGPGKKTLDGKRSPPRERLAVAGVLLLVQVLFGLHYLAAKIVLAHIPPRAWATLRASGAAAILLLLAKLLGRTLPSSPALLGRLAAFSIFGVVINQVCFVEGLYRTSATHSSILNTIIPVGTLLFAGWLGHERLSARKIAATLVALAGVLLVVRPEAARTGSEALAGDLLTLANALSYSFFLAVSKPTVDRLDPLGATAALMGFGAVGIFLIGGGQLLSSNLRAVPATVWLVAAGIVALPTAAAYFMIYWALGKADPSVVALFIYLQPVLASALAILLLDERPRATTWVGAALVFAGVFLAVRGRPDS